MRFICDLCPSVFDDNMSVKKHMLEVHSQTVRRIWEKLGTSGIFAQNVETTRGQLLINSRQSTHGNWLETCAFAQAIKHLFRTGPLWKNLSDSEREALESIGLKITRILCGGSHEDHWNDIEGYSALGRGIRAQRRQEG